MSRTVNSGIINQLRKKILSGGFDQVTFLPSERKLADEYQVGRGIIRGALRVLRDEGIIYNVPKRGFRITARGERRRMKRVILRMSAQISSRAFETFGLVAGICAGANEIFAEVILSTPPAELDLAELQERFNAGDIQGIIFMESSYNLSIQDVVDAGIPCVVANLEEDLPFPGVRMDYRGIGRMAGEKLFAGGSRRPAVCCGGDRLLFREMLAGFRGAAAEEGVVLDESMIATLTLGGDVSDLERLLLLPPDKRPDAIFTMRDCRAEVLYKLCAKHSLKIPEDIGVISFDNISWPEAENAGLTTITEEVREIGRQSLFLLQQQFESGFAPVTCIIPGQLVERKSLKKVNTSRKIIYHPNN